MSLKLSKDERERKNALEVKLRDTMQALADAIETYNGEVEKLRAPVETALDAYNAVLTDVRGLAEDIATQASEDIADKSEKWQEGERGQAATEYQSTWENAVFDDIEVTWPDELSIDEPSHADDLEQLPEQPE